MGLTLMEKFFWKETALPANLHSPAEQSHLEIPCLEKCQTRPRSSAYVEVFTDSSGTASS